MNNSELAFPESNNFASDLKDSELIEFLQKYNFHYKSFTKTEIQLPLNLDSYLNDINENLNLNALNQLIFDLNLLNRKLIDSRLAVIIYNLDQISKNNTKVKFDPKIINKSMSMYCDL